MKHLKKWMAAGLALLLTLSLASCGGSSGTQGTENPAQEQEEEASSPIGEEPAKAVPGVTVEEDAASPSGYSAHFVFDAANAEKTVESVSVSGPFQYVNPSRGLTEEGNRYGPEAYQNGMYATNFAPSAGMADGWGYTVEMEDTDGDGIYEASFPITSGSFAYSYVIQYEGEEAPVTIDDPANPSPAKNNPDSITATGDLTHSIAYGKWDAEKQSDSPNLDYVLPVGANAGTLSYVPYEGTDGVTQYLGVYLPAGYDAAREEPYKTIYMSHGGGGNETDWFAMGHLDNIMDNLLSAGETEEALVVTMDNAHYEWDFAQIEDNVLTKIIPFMEEQYNVSTAAADRAFAGLSMGCMTTMHMYFDHPLEFGYFGMFSAADMTAVRENEGLDVPVVMAAVGSCDIASATILPETDPDHLIKYESFVEWLDSQELPNITAYGYIPGAHDWFTWSQCFYHFATEFLWK